MEKTQRLTDQFSYQLDEWERTTGFEPIDVIASADISGSYEMEAMHVFKLKRGYGIVYESGCSCYDSSWAKIDILPDLAAVRESLKNWGNDVSALVLQELMGVK